MLGLVASIIALSLAAVTFAHGCRHLSQKWSRSRRYHSAPTGQHPSSHSGRWSVTLMGIACRRSLWLALLSAGFVPALALLVIAGLNLPPTGLIHAQGTGLRVEILAAYNLVVDSNVESPSTYAPSVATVAGRFCNESGGALTDVQGFIGNYVDGTSDTPGLYPVRDSDNDQTFKDQHPHLANTGLYAFTHVGGRAGRADASRYVGSLAPGECKVQYWHFTYPRRANPDNTGVAVWGNTNDPNDDLWLEFDIWATSAGGYADNATWRATMRNEISAMANKIEPQGGAWFNTNTNQVSPGDLITSNGVRYDLGNINKGFDNDGDGDYDYNLWLQPIGDPSYDPSCFRLVRTSGVLTVSLTNGVLVIPFQDKLYFTDLPANNTGAVGNVHYTFLALNGPCNTNLTPYQEVASGADNEKFNGDYGAGIPPVVSTEPEVMIDKTGTAVVSLGSNITYQVPVANHGTADAGMPLISDGGDMPWVPVVISDSIPAGMVYVAGSATHNFTSSGVIVLFSSDSGATWSAAEPVPASAVTNIQWWLTDTLRAGHSGDVGFDVTVPGSYAGSYVENCADASFGGGPSFAEACSISLVEGNNRIGDTVWRDENNNRAQDGGESGLADITVSLILDRDGDGVRDVDEWPVMTATSSITGYYMFSDLPNGAFLVEVDRDDPDLPFGYSTTTEPAYAVLLSGGDFLDADFGFGPALSVNKSLLMSPALEDRDITYVIDVTNRRPGNGTGQPAACTVAAWAGGGSTGSSPKDFTASGNAFGSDGPDWLYASADFATGANKYIIGTTYQPGNPSGNITKVEAVFHLYMSRALVDDFASAQLLNGAVILTQTSTTPAVAQTGPFRTAVLNGQVGIDNAGLVVWDITNFGPVGSWDWTDFALNLSLRLDLQKDGGADDGILYLDALGFRITTDQTCGSPSDTLDPVPLVDVYDASKLQFLSAEPPASTVTTGLANPYANTGRITWANLGPLYAGQTQSVVVTFRGLEPPSNSPISITNTATVSGARFIDSQPANDDTNDAVTTLYPTGSIGDRVWNDNGAGGGTAANGIQDGGEAGIPGVIVELYAGNGTTLLMTTTTSITGYYLFAGLTDGDYVVRVNTASLPGTTFTQTGDPERPDANCSGGNRCDNQSPVTLSGSSDLTNRDFGYRVPNTIYGNIWEDNNADASQQAGENGLAGVTVRLYNNSGGLIATTTTDAAGDYVFSDLNDGSYYVQVVTGTLPAGGTWAQTVDPDEMGKCSTCDSQKTTVAASGGNVYGAYDFAYTRSGSLTLGDTLYVDWNGDGDQDSGEEGIPNVTLWLYEDSDADGSIDPATDALIATTATDSSGTYSFANLPAGDYIVVVDSNDTDFPFAAGGYNQAQDYDGDADGQAVVHLTISLDNVDFGYQPRGTASIGDLVWSDANRNGTYGLGETGLPDILVTLYQDQAGNGVFDPADDALVMTATTGADGRYLFANLPAGRYLVDVDTTDSDLPTDAYSHPYVLTTQNDPHPVDLAAGEVYELADFGFATGVVLGDFVWRDDDRAGDQDPAEPGIASAVVELYSWTDTDGDHLYTAGTDIQGGLIMSATTNASGYYSFTGLAAGYYLVAVDTTSTPTDTFTYDPNGPIDGQGSVILSASQRYYWGADFGLPSSNGAIGGHLWIDLDDDDTYDEPAEPGIGTTMVISLTNGVDVFTTTTDSDGAYIFRDLPAGTYTITYPAGSVPAGLEQTFEEDGSLNQQVTVSLALGENSLGVDFGYVPQLSLDKTSSGAGIPLGAGEALTYTIVVSNPSPVTVKGAAMSDLIPTHTNFVAGSLGIIPPSAGGPGTPPPIYINPLTITAHSLVTVTFQVTVADPIPAGVQAVTNTVTLTAPFGLVITDSVTNGVATPSADLAISKTDSPDPVPPGAVLTYTLTYTNAGPADAQAVVITDSLPADVTYGGVISQPAGWSDPPTYTPGSPATLSWTSATLPANASGQMVFTVTVAGTAGETLTNTVSITTTTPDGDLNNNQDEELTEIESADLELGKTVDSATPNLGATITFTLTITNVGPHTATHVTVRDILPAGLAFVSASPSSGAYTPASGEWTISSLPDGMTVTLSIKASVTGTGTITNSAEIVTSDQFDPDSSPANGMPGEDDQDEVSVTVQSGTVSGHLYYDTNGNGSQDPGEPDLANVDLLITDSTGLTQTVTSDANGDWSAAVPPGSTSADVDEADPDYPTGYTQTEGTDPTTVTAVAGTDTDAGNDGYSCASDLSLFKSASSELVVAGRVLTYTLLFENIGPAAAQGITITEQLPAGATYGGDIYLPVGMTRINTNPPTWFTPTLAAGNSQTIIFTTTVGSGVWGLITNTATISTPTDENPNNNTDDALTGVITQGIAVAKTPDRQSVAVGSDVTFTITVTNTGEVTLAPVVVSDPLAPDCDTTIPFLAAGTSISYTCVLTNVVADLTNTIVVTGTPPAGDLLHDSDDADVVVLRPGLELSKSVTPGTGVRSMPITYSLYITNTGQLLADPLVLTDTLPADFHYLPGSGTPADPDIILGRNLVWQDLGPLAPGHSLTVTFAVTTTPSVLGTYYNAALAEATTPGGVVTATDQVPLVVSDPTLSLDKNLMPPGVVDGVLTYTIRITNTGPSILDVVPLVDHFTGPIQYVGGTPAPDVVNNSVGMLRWDDLTGVFGDMAPGQVFSLAAVFRLTTTAETFSATNTANVSVALDTFANPANEAQDTVMLVNAPTAINLLYFQARQEHETVLLSWATAVEIDNYGFRILRSSSGQLADALQIAFVPGQGHGTADGATYTYADADVLAGQTYTYWLVDVDYSGEQAYHGPRTVQVTKLKRIYMPLIFKGN